MRHYSRLLVLLATWDGINNLLFVMSEQPPRGRGSTENSPNRFHRLHVEPDLDDVPLEDRSAPATEFLKGIQ